MSNEKLAKQIIDDLFDTMSVKAAGIALLGGDGERLGGWCREAAERQVLLTIKKAEVEAHP